VSGSDRALLRLQSPLSKNMAKNRQSSGNSRAASQPFGVLTEKTNGGNETVVREQTGNRSLVVFDRGDEVTVQAGDEGIRFLLVSGKQASPNCAAARSSSNFVMTGTSPTTTRHAGCACTVRRSMPLCGS
jgi:hypothetical protein